jgi:hypothetical protein
MLPKNNNKRHFSEAKSNILSSLKPINKKAPDLTNDPKISAFIKKEIQAGLQSTLRGASPKANTVAATEQEQSRFNKMTYKERLNLFNSNPQVYNKLAKGAKNNADTIK